MLNRFGFGNFLDCHEGGPSDLRFSDGLKEGLTVVAFVMSAGGWMNLMLKRRLRRSVFQMKNGVHQRDRW
jgi:hypothetical protein